MILTLAAAALAVLASASSAFGAFHLVKISEIGGDPGSANSAFIELQMYNPGQNLVSGHKITLWDEDGLVLGNPTPVGELTLTGPNPPNGQNQRTILIGDSGVIGRDFPLDFSPYLDATAGSNLVAAGAACFEAIPVDCVSWGGPAFTGAANLPDGTTPNASALPTTDSLHRIITRGCRTALEASDDTDSASFDFFVTTRDPEPNASAPTERLCAAPVRCGGLRATKVGNARNNVLVGTPRRDVIAGLGGNDTIRGLRGNDIVCGGPGKDKLFGGPGRDRLIGGPGRDLCAGGPGRDVARSCERRRSI